MYELARCVVTGDGATLTGYVEHFDSTVLAVRFDRPVEGLEVAGEVEVRVLDDVRGEVHFGASVAQVDDQVVHLAGLYEIAVRQRRAAARVRISVPLTGTITTGDPPRTAPLKLTVLDVSASGGTLSAVSRPATALKLTVLDVSASGAKLLVTDRLPLDAKIAFAFPVGDGVVVDLVAEVVWSEESVSGWRHGCRYVDIGPKDVELLFRYVLLTQGAQLRRAHAADG